MFSIIICHKHVLNRSSIFYELPRPRWADRSSVFPRFLINKILRRTIGVNLLLTFASISTPTMCSLSWSLVVLNRHCFNILRSRFQIAIIRERNGTTKREENQNFCSQQVLQKKICHVKHLSKSPKHLIALGENVEIAFIIGWLTVHTCSISTQRRATPVLDWMPWHRKYWNGLPMERGLLQLASLMRNIPAKSWQWPFLGARIRRACWQER